MKQDYSLVIAKSKNHLKKMIHSNQCGYWKVNDDCLLLELSHLSVTGNNRIFKVEYSELRNKFKIGKIIQLV